MAEYSRQAFLKLSVGAVVAPAVGVGLLGACSSESPTSPSPDTDSTAAKSPVAAETSHQGEGGRAAPPSYAPISVVKADLPGDASGIVPNGYFKYPDKLVSVNHDVPGHGGEVTAFMRDSGRGVPPPPSRNKFWAELNKRLGVDFKAQVVPGADYIAKLQTTLAGNDLPDILQVFPSQVSQIPGIAKAKFQDLSDYLSGDAIKKYPNLAAISTTAWTNSMIGGRIYGVVRNSLIPHVMLIRRDLAQQQGVDLAGVKTFDEFFKMCETFTDTRKSTYACAYPSGLLTFLKESCAVPNVWKEDGGHLTWANETDQMKDALTAFAKLWKAGLLHPDSFTNTNDIYTWLVSGRTAMMENSLNNLSYIAGLAGADEVTFAALHVPSYNGADPVCLGSSGYDSITALRKTSDSSRVEELLSVLNWMAAPFGSEEQQFCFFGVPNVDFTVKDGQPAPTTTGLTETALYVYFLAKCDDYLYFAGRPDDVKAMHDYAAYVEPAVIFNPVIGLYSETDDSDGPALAKTVNDTINDIMQGRKAVTALDSAVEQWRKNGGDKIRQEYEDAIQQAS